MKLRFLKIPPNELFAVIEKEFEMSSEEINYWKNLIFGNSIIINLAKEHDIIKSHSFDNKFIDVAIEAGADYIVSGDRHLLELKEFQGIKIITAKEMVLLSK